MLTDEWRKNDKHTHSTFSVQMSEYRSTVTELATAHRSRQIQPSHGTRERMSNLSTCQSGRDSNGNNNINTSNACRRLILAMR